eukprot:scaffold100468_cov18-Tisochrysis_lutea.AAC.2
MMHPVQVSILGRTNRNRNRKLPQEHASTTCQASTLSAMQSDPAGLSFTLQPSVMARHSRAL